MNMKEEVCLQSKFKEFECICKGGDIIKLKSPISKVTLGTAMQYAPNWAKVQLGKLEIEVIAIKGIE